MKNKIITISKTIALLLVTVTLFSSCGEEHDFAPYSESVAATAAKVKFTNAAIGPNGTNFSVNWFVNDVKTTAALTLTGLPLGIAYGGQYPSVYNYALLPSGSQSLRVEIPATATIPTATVFSFPLTTEAKMNYSTFVVGASPNYAAYTVKDNLNIADADPTKAYIRFLNLIPNSPTTGYDLSIKELNSNAVLYSGVKYLQGNEVFIPITPVPDLDALTYEIQLKTIGTATIVAKITMTPRKGRIYTFLSRGYVGGLSNGLPSATVNIPVVAWYTNK
ncbi:DUF4397 domain-containing protein [Flavobacterium sp. ZS1P14]|uniref:DUF4397 domain-containing protein n=1 Tax=Flavobacterium sp. ZS1P14 TaxID=3401729 RepID=UPI003AAFC3F8